jgi:hypothetical protein
VVSFADGVGKAKAAAARLEVVPFPVWPPHVLGLASTF